MHLLQFALASIMERYITMEMLSMTHTMEMEHALLLFVRKMGKL